MKDSDVHTKAAPLIWEVLHSIPVVQDVRVEEQTGSSVADFRVDVWIRGAGGQAVRYVLLVETKSNGQPRWVRAAADQLDRHVKEGRGDQNTYGVFVAPYVSESGAEILRKRGFGYLDLAGNGCLAFEGIYVERRGTPNPFSERSELRTLFSPKTSRVLRVLLMRPHEPWRMAALAGEAGVSIGLVAKVKPLLVNQEWAADTAEGLVLNEPGSALDAWAAGFRRRRSDVRDYYGFGSMRELEERVAASAEALGSKYALAEFSGAERLAPHVRYSRAAAYVEADALEEVAKHAGLRPVETGPNVRLIKPYDAGVFLGSAQPPSAKDGALVAHPVQLYLDLQKAKGRGEEAAGFLRRQVLEPMWTASQQGIKKTSGGVLG